MQAILLAAGYATRLYPETKNFPKALLSVGGRPMLDHLADGVLSIREVSRVIVVSNDKYYGRFCVWAQARGDARIIVLNDGTRENGARLGAIGDMRYAIDHLNIDEDLLVVAGDNYLCVDFSDFYQRYVDLGRKTLLLGQYVNDVETLRRFATAKADASGRVVKLVEKPESPDGNLAIFALYLYPQDTVRKLADYAGEGNTMDAPGYFPQWLFTREDVYVYATRESCYDIGTPESLAEARALFGA